MKKQITSHIMMVRPANFGFNEETAENNAFQDASAERDDENIRKNAIREFDTFVEILRTNGIKVEVVQDSKEPVKTDAVFPNNWISFHEDGTVITYPMFSKIRRAERQESIIDQIASSYTVSNRYSFEQYEEEDSFLEGTGSMILDRENNIVYACLSDRTDIKILDKWCVLMNYRKVVFQAVDESDVPIYHTNVMMSLGETFAIICLESVRSEEEQRELLASFMQTGKSVIEISLAQMNAFAGNMLQVSNRLGSTFLVMSEKAFQSLEKEQLEEIEKHTQILRAPLNTIETYGGGSARCMMAEIFLDPIGGSEDMF